jgi:iron-sulfur cluster assembly 2
MMRQPTIIAARVVPNTVLCLTGRSRSQPELCRSFVSMNFLSSSQQFQDHQQQPHPIIPCHFPLHSTFANDWNIARNTFNHSHRNIVTVTKTKVAELPSELNDEDEEVDSNSKRHATATAANYTIESDTLIVTPNCLNRVERLIHQRQNDKTNMDDNSDNYFLRVYVDAGGCSGFQYQFELDNDFDQDDDIVIVSAMNEAASSTEERPSPRVVTDATSLEFLEGATLDYVMEMIKSSFVVRDNPQSESACGCGSSFARKNFTVNPATD